MIDTVKISFPYQHLQILPSRFSMSWERDGSLPVHQLQLKQRSLQRERKPHPWVELCAHGVYRKVVLQVGQISTGKKQSVLLGEYNNFKECTLRVLSLAAERR